MFSCNCRFANLAQIPRIPCEGNCPKNDKRVFSKKRASLLVDGNIPPFTECPFKNEYQIAYEGNCAHNGKSHTITFSCEAAKGFNVINSISRIPLSGFKTRSMVSSGEGVHDSQGNKY